MVFRDTVGDIAVPVAAFSGSDGGNDAAPGGCAVAGTAFLWGIGDAGFFILGNMVVAGTHQNDTFSLF